MPKKYEFFFTFSTQSFNHSGISSEFFTLGHKELTAQDLFDVSCKFREEHGCSANVISFVLNKVTGDFTYNVIYQKKEFGQWITYSQFYIQDHKYISSTAKSDFREFIRFLYPSNSVIAPKEWDSENTKVLSFQEVPEE